jgi:selenocysteine-specific elongation factor
MRTIIGSASIIDMMLLIIDINKGIEIQTAECMILGELIGLKVIVALNKIDVIKDGQKEKIQAKVESSPGLRRSEQDLRQDPVFPAAEGD